MPGAGRLELDDERSVWRVVAGALVLYRRYPVLFFVLAVVVVAPYDLCVMALTGAGPLGRAAHRGFALGLLLDLVDFSLVGPFISALHTHAVVLAGEGVTPRLRSVAARGLRVLPVVMAVEIVANLGIYVGFLLVIPGIILALRWSVAAQAAAVEHDGWMPALSSSRKLTSGHYWRIAGLFALIGLPTLAVRLAAQALPLGGSSAVRSVMAGIAINTVTASFVALVLALLYFDLLARQLAPAARRAQGYEHVRDLD
jgi:hypothetical protein